MRAGLLGLIGGFVLAGSAAAQAPAPLLVYGNKQTIELAPILLAAKGGSAEVRMGGIPNLVGEAGAPGFSGPGIADLATNAETQLLRQSLAHPNLRIVMRVTEGRYHLVARRSAGIARAADLKGKRVATIAPTSAGYFLYRVLEGAGLGLADVTLVPLPGGQISAIPGMMQRHQIDAVAMWEPAAENAGIVLGADRIDLAAPYAEQFNLNTTSEALADAGKRARIVAFMRRVIGATAELRRDPREAQRLVAEAGPFQPRDVAASWHHHAFTADMPANMLDILEREERWLAEQDKRPARPRTELARLIDTSAYREAIGQGSRR